MVESIELVLSSFQKRTYGNGNTCQVLNIDVWYEGTNADEKF